MPGVETAWALDITTALASPPHSCHCGYHDRCPLSRSNRNRQPPFDCSWPLSAVSGASLIARFGALDKSTEARIFYDICCQPDHRTCAVPGFNGTAARINEHISFSQVPVIHLASSTHAPSTNKCGTILSTRRLRYCMSSPIRVACPRSWLVSAKTRKPSSS